MIRIDVQTRDDDNVTTAVYETPQIRIYQKPSGFNGPLKILIGV